MTDCIRCNGRGYLGLVMGDDDYLCPECQGTGENVDAIVAEYTHRYRYPFLLTWLLEADRAALESARDDYWYLCGKYEETGHDRHGVTYVTVDSEKDDNEFEDTTIEREIETGEELRHG